MSLYHICGFVYFRAIIFKIWTSFWPIMYVTKIEHTWNCLAITGQVLFMELTFQQKHTSVLSHILHVNYIFPIWVTESDDTLILYVKTVIKRFQIQPRYLISNWVMPSFGWQNMQAGMTLSPCVHLITLCKYHMKAGSKCNCYQFNGTHPIVSNHLSHK
jgi:hypothetical protein